MPGDLRIVSYNIRYGGRGRASALGRVIRACAPDVVILQEATDPDVVASLATLAGLPFWRSSAGDSLAWLSRVPVESSEWHRPSVARRAFLSLTLRGAWPRIFGVHLSAVHASWTERRRVRELRAILERTALERDRFHVVVGDFNTLAPGEQLDVAKLPRRLRPLVWLSGGRIRWQTIQVMLEAGYADAFRVLNAAAEGHTFPAWSPHVRLDYAFVPAAHAGRLSSCRVLHTAVDEDASDHFPLLLDLDT